MNKVILRADGNSEIGYGHVFRLLSLVQMINEEFDCTFLIREPEEFIREEILKTAHHVIELPEKESLSGEVEFMVKEYLSGDEVVVLDGYRFEPDYQKVIKSNGNQLVFIDDLAEQHFLADVVINHAVGIKKEDYSTEDYTSLLLGPNYALIRKAFLEVAKKPRKIDELNSIFISMGGTEQVELLQNIIEGIKQTNSYNHLHVLGGNQIKEKVCNNVTKSSPQIHFYSGLNQHELIRLMEKCEVAICPASTLSYEVAAVGLGLLTGYTFQNQLFLNKGLINQNVAESLGYLPDLKAEDWKKEIESLTLEVVNNQIDGQRKFIDGSSQQRIREVFNTLVSN